MNREQAVLLTVAAVTLALLLLCCWPGPSQQAVRDTKASMGGSWSVARSVVIAVMAALALIGLAVSILLMTETFFD